jgi:murein DD-endopeptidase MepM/ murein hydrolase activator NlpD
VAFNNHFGDYGATIILQHNIDTTSFHTLYGHVSLTDLQQLRIGQFITRGQCLAHIGAPHENGNWPPHLHFQIIEDMQLKEGDYPGVCKVSEKAYYLKNCPDADLVLQLMQYASA